jgi:hypothetical protein
MTQAPPRSGPLRDLVSRLGVEAPLQTVHHAILRAAHDIRPVVESGAVLATCSDEFNGEIRTAFVRDVARQLNSPNMPGNRRIFSVANLGGRIEPGAIALADVHFTAATQRSGEKLLLVEIASHVGWRRSVAGETARVPASPLGRVWGELDRFGVPSACCGALRLLLDSPTAAAAVRFPWFDQLTAFFGPERLAALRADPGPWPMLKAAIVHAVLQAETAMVDLLREPPRTPTHVLLVSMVVVNRRGPDDAFPVGVHHLHFRDGVAHLEHGSSLRSTPGALEIEKSGQGLLTVRSPFPEEAAESELESARQVAGTTTAAAPVVVPDGEFTLVVPTPHAATPELTRHVQQTREQLAVLERKPHAMRVYARPLLRAFLQGLSVLAPEVGLAAMAVGGVRELKHAHDVERLLKDGPSSEEARHALHDIEPLLQQLGHREARQVLEVLLADHGPLFGSRTVR